MSTSPKHPANFTVRVECASGKEDYLRGADGKPVRPKTLKAAHAAGAAAMSEGTAVDYEVHPGTWER